jgi:hypothetical protein
MNEHPLKDMATREMSLLRQELHNLKTCQFAFLTTAFTATGLIFGFFVKSGAPEYSYLIFLAPLIVIFPCFCFFFDKAGTITRIVGYYRILEDITGNASFPGWENSLSKSRSGSDTMDHGFFSLAKRIIFFLKPYGYWSLAFDTFVSLIIISIICACFYPFKPDDNHTTHWIVLLPIIVLSILFIVRNFFVLKNLMVGENSYESNYNNWKNILEIT